ncbi:hypothetical protein HDU98_010688 [Podochytrium sp. JEL0797]|nr:hypothetical protein HDU98_010688 [Podochytrium sp. JEL0797]
MFMVIDVKMGGDLRFHLTKSGPMQENQVRFYMAECALGLMYLHSKNVVHRDMKPDNILLDEKGHACLTDFNIATYWKEDKPLHAVAGSMAYMAPEILEKKKPGYTYTIDWWSLGVIAFELLVGKVGPELFCVAKLTLSNQRPFRGATNEELTDVILKGTLEFPPKVADTLSQEGKNIIKGWVTHSPTERLGSKETGGDTKITNHAWFAEYDWFELEALESKKANFDGTHELEEILMEENPLHAKPRCEDGKSYLYKIHPKEAEKMDTKFLYFDHSTLATPVNGRKKSMAWTNKLTEIKKSQKGLVESDVEDQQDLMEFRSAYLVVDTDYTKSMTNMSTSKDSADGPVPSLPRSSNASPSKLGLPVRVFEEGQNDEGQENSAVVVFDTGLEVPPNTTMQQSQIEEQKVGNQLEERASQGKQGGADQSVSPVLETTEGTSKTKTEQGGVKDIPDSTDSARREQVPST